MNVSSRSMPGIAALSLPGGIKGNSPIAANIPRMRLAAGTGHEPGAGASIADDHPFTPGFGGAARSDRVAYVR
jgi:hypothetical protein